jgi:diazepam-binding inhibitor (GABA receptor modulating acyl-CoA-binding protein)
VAEDADFNDAESQSDGDAAGPAPGGSGPGSGPAAPCASDTDGGASSSSLVHVRRPPSVAAQFRAATEHARTLASTASQDDLLQLYGLFKQAKLGDCPAGERPSMFRVLARSKYDAWHALRGARLSKEEAMARYVSTVERISPGFRGESARR